MTTAAKSDGARELDSTAPGENSAGARWIPEQSRPERYISFTLFAVSFLYLCIFRHYTSMEPDEGIVLQGAQRILAGQVPYRDFFSFYTPGSYYALAAVFRIFGSSLVVARIALALAGATLSALSYLLARRVCSRGMALTLAALGTLTTLPYRFLVLHNWDSTLWACLAIYALVRLLETPASGSWEFAAGIFASLTALSEQSKGAGLCLGLAIGLLAIWFVEGKPVLTRAALLALLSGFAIPLVITFAYFASQHAASAMLADWLWPLRHYSVANRVPYGYQNWSDASRHLLFGTGSPFVRLIKAVAVSPCFWIPALPPVAVGLLVYWIVKTRRSAATAASRYYILVAAAYLGLALSVVLTRADIIHFMYLQPLNCVVLAWLLGSRELDSRETTRLLRRARPVLAAYVVISLSIFGLAPLANTASAPERLMTRRGEVTTPARDTVVEYFQAHVPPGKTVLIYPYLPLYYYLTAAFSPGPYDYFQPGMHTREQADEIVRELASGRVDEVLFEPNFSDKVAHSWPGTPLAAIAQDPVADYIAHHYRPCQELASPAGWKFLFMVRKDESCD